VFWIIGGVLAWVLVAAVVAVVLGRAVRMADERSPGTGVDRPLTTADLPLTVGGTRRVVAPRRRIPLPPVAIGLASVAVGLEAFGYGLRLSGATGQVARLLSMDAPFSAPRLFVAGLFAASAMASIAGAGSLPGRRTWWTAVAVVAAGVAVVKTGSTIHSNALAGVSAAIGTTGAVLASVVLAAAVVGWLWSLSRGERRDRRRVLSCLALYAGAAVGLSAVSTFVAGAAGAASRWAAMATFVEESGEALTAVAFLMAVFVGVAPRLVLPADWVLRRTDDAHTLDVPQAIADAVRTRPPTAG
jgi:hypothetical protein